MYVCVGGFSSPNYHVCLLGSERDPAQREAEGPRSSITEAESDMRVQICVFAVHARISVSSLAFLC